MPSETERAIEYVRRAIADFRLKQDAPAALLLHEHDRLKAELARLTEPQDASTHDGKTYVLAWAEDKPGRRIPFVTTDRLSKRDKWTPLPNPSEQEDAHEPQE